MEIFENWIIKFNERFEMLNRHVFLLLDNAAGHFINETSKKKFNNVSIQMLHPNTTSVIQPCDQGIKRSMKSHYRRKLVKYCINSIDTKNELILPNVKEEIDMIREVCDKVSSETISNCWKQSGYLKLIKKSKS